MACVCKHVHMCCLLLHAGFLCGSCPAGTAVSLDLQSCSDQCAVGIIVFIVMCKCSVLEEMNALARIIHASDILVSSKSPSTSSLSINLLLYARYWSCGHFPARLSQECSASIRAERFHLLCSSDWLGIWPLQQCDQHRIEG